ncbi:hypothetical protein ACQ86N_46670 [Puia sp. P3]|uniref:hypothetical protein n=1 Tax=Puia sp. P3 TaxID=3423952 RepID=UPI003D674C22
MSLYTFSKVDHFPALEPIPGLHIEVSNDPFLLALTGDLAEGEVARRLASENLQFIAFVYGQPAAFGWMARGRQGSAN